MGGPYPKYLNIQLFPFKNNNGELKMCKKNSRTDLRNRYHSSKYNIHVDKIMTKLNNNFFVHCLHII